MNSFTQNAQFIEPDEINNSIDKDQLNECLLKVVDNIELEQMRCSANKQIMEIYKHARISCDAYLMWCQQ